MVNENPTHIVPTSFFYAVGNTPAVNLTKSLPPDQDADVLLLGCGDVRNILLSVYTGTGSGQKIDFTCCDIETEALARNIILFTLILDDTENKDVEKIWNIYYHVLVDEDSLRLLREQASKLRKVAGTAEEWNKSKYGHTLRFCDSYTFSQVLQLWKLYALQPSDGQPFKEQQERLQHAPRSDCAIDDVPASYETFWKTGSSRLRQLSNPTNLNPMFGTTNSRFYLHYGTDPVTGYHLATAYTGLSPDSPLKGDPAKGRQMGKCFNAALDQFHAFVKAFRKSASHLTIRFIVTDALGLCHTLKHIQHHGNSSTVGWYRSFRTWEPLALDTADYSQEKTGAIAPLLFDIIDTSNLVDHFGCLSLLTTAGPPLKPKPTSTLSTELLVKRELNIDQYKKTLLFGDLQSVALLFSLVPVETWTGTTADSGFDERVISDVGGGRGAGAASQSRFILHWKSSAVSTEGASQSSPDRKPSSLTFDAKELAQNLFQIYQGMFHDEDHTNWLSGSRERLQRKPYGHYTRASFAAILSHIRVSNMRVDLVIGIQPPSSGPMSPELVKSETSLHDSYSSFSNYSFVIIFHLSEKDKGNIAVNAIHDDKAISPAAARRMIYQFEHILNQVIESPEITLDSLNMICPQDQVQLSEWHGALPLAHGDSGLHDLVLSHTARHPGASAIHAWDGVVSYLELDDMSLRLARRLHRLGVQRGSMIPLCLDRSKWVIICMIAVLRAGGACVMLDPGHPTERMEDILRRTEAKLVVTSSGHQDRFSSTQATILPIPAALEEGPSIDWTVPGWDPMDPAFIVFTSGSTGKPKGILMNHSAICTSIRDHTNSLIIEVGATRGLHFASYAFDASIYEIFSVLVNGGCVCIPSEADRTSNLSGFINASQVNWAVFTPTVLNNILHPEQVPGLQAVVVGGEALTQDVLDIWADKVALINGYGPAETTICAAGLVPAQGWLPGTIGKITGGVGWITVPYDPSRLAPVGAVGELVMEGPVVARGYLNDPEKTVEVYIPAPVWLKQFRNADTSQTGRLYRSGDLVQYTDDGGIRFFGRRDTQVKLRGQRIELGEVEYRTARAFPDAQEVVAEMIYRNRNKRDATLVVFITTGCDETSELFVGYDSRFTAAVQAATVELSKQLPRYMVPATFLHVSRVPRTRSGKIDRQSLREQAATHNLDEFTKSKRAAPREPTMKQEHLLRDLWAEALQLPAEQIGTDDNFFDLGGDSVKAMRVSNLARQLGSRISLLDMFNNSTLSELARATEQSLQDITDDDYCPGSLLGIANLKCFIARFPGLPTTLTPDHVADVLPTTQLQASIMDDKNATYFALPLPKGIDTDRLDEACRAMVDQNPSLRTILVPYGAQYIQIILQKVDLPITRLTCEGNMEDFVQSVCAQDYNTPIPAEVPQVRFYLFSHTTGAHQRLVIRASHSLLDFVSAILILKEISTAYDGKDLPSHAPSFARYLQYRLLNRPSNTSQFWRDYLHNSQVTILKGRGNHALPMSNPTPARPTAVFKEIPLPIMKEGVTMATLTKAAWALVLAQVTGQDDVLFGHVLNGRELPIANVEEVPGPCITLSPLRVRIQRSWIVKSLLRHVQQQYKRSMPFSSMEFYEIKRLMAPHWSPDAKFCSVFTHQNEGVERTINFQGTECPVEMFQHNTSTPFHVVTGPQGENLFIALSVLDPEFCQEDMDDLAKKLAATVNKLAVDYSATLEL